MLHAIAAGAAMARQWDSKKKPLQNSGFFIDTTKRVPWWVKRSNTS